MRFPPAEIRRKAVFPEQVAEEVKKLAKRKFRGNREIRIMEKEDLEYYNLQRHGLL